MKNLLIVCLLMSSFTLLSQGKSKKNERKEQIEQAKIAFISRKIELTTEQAENFWPIYNEMQAEIKAHRKSIKTDLKQLKSDSLNQDDKSYENALNDRHEDAIKFLEIKKEYSRKIGELLGYKKVFDLGDAEIAFKKQLVNRMKNAPSGRGEKGPSKGNQKY
tara:strand:+ start:1087 stop:1572 length:486 start_codon:yes stop_codon:yes gene_type:complete